MYLESNRPLRALATSSPSLAWAAVSQVPAAAASSLVCSGYEETRITAATRRLMNSWIAVLRLQAGDSDDEGDGDYRPGGGKGMPRQLAL